MIFYYFLLLFIYYNLLYYYNLQLFLQLIITTTLLVHYLRNSSICVRNIDFVSLFRYIRNHLQHHQKISFAMKTLKIKMELYRNKCLLHHQIQQKKSNVNFYLFYYSSLFFTSLWFLRIYFRQMKWILFRLKIENFLISILNEWISNFKINFRWNSIRFRG